MAIVGSSNLTLSGVIHNTELNVVVQGNNNHGELVRNGSTTCGTKSEDFDETLMQEIRQSWAVAPVRPYDVYMKTLYALVRDRLEGEDDKDILWDDEITPTGWRLPESSRTAGHSDDSDYGGAFVADVVGSARATSARP